MATVDGTLTATWAGWDAEVGSRTVHGGASSTWAGWDASVNVGDTVTVKVYDQTGTEFQAQAASAKPTYRIALGGSGDTCGMTLLIDDVAAPYLTDRAIIKATCRGQTDGFRVKDEAASLAVDGNGWLTFSGMPSLIGCLHDGPVYPEGGLPASQAISKNAPTTRAFGPMNPRGPWYTGTVDWSRPLGVLIALQTNHRRGYPKELASVPAVYWINPSPGPEADFPAGTVAHFRREFTTTVATPVEFVFTADNYFSLWLDGQEIIPVDYAPPQVWKQTYTYQVTLQPGAHVVYARIENAKGNGTTNPMGLCGVIFQLDSSGNRIGVITRTHPSFWWSTLNDVGWYPAQIIYQLMTESAAANDGASILTPTFTPTHDSDGVAWSGTRVTKLFNVMQDCIDDVIAALSQDGVDVVADAQAMTLNAYNRLGSDLYSSVELKLGSAGGNLKQYDTTTTGTRANAAAATLADGRWHTVIDTAGVAALGGKLVWMPGIQLGTTNSPEAAELTMRQILAETAQPVTSATAQPSTLTGEQLFRSYGLGDSIKTPGKRGTGTLKQRCVAYNVDGTGDIVRLWPEFTQDGT